jgi:AraC family transcriptional regulator, regulatory protein of adaptative response / methylated-DNA-[protein]-cysteine methyltransferase
MEAIRYAIGASSLGLVLVAASDAGVCAMFIDDDRDSLQQDLARRFPTHTLIADEVALAALVRQVVAAVESPAIPADIALDMRGTEFQQRVWRALREIPAGTTVTYTDLASRVGMTTNGARAVGNACASNPIAVLVPCHRVITSDGKLAAYRWGVARKRSLLAMEAAR